MSVSSTRLCILEKQRLHLDHPLSSTRHGCWVCVFVAHNGMLFTLGLMITCTEQRHDLLHLKLCLSQKGAWCENPSWNPESGLQSKPWQLQFIKCLLCIGTVLHVLIILPHLILSSVPWGQTHWRETGLERSYKTYTISTLVNRQTEIQVPMYFLLSWHSSCLPVGKSSLIICNSVQGAFANLSLGYHSFEVSKAEHACPSPIL